MNTRTFPTLRPKHAPLNRRRFLEIAAGCGVAALGAARAAQVGLLSTSRHAYDAWDDPAREPGLRAIVAAGVLAANPHDSQPWRFRLDDHRIDVHLDLGRALGPVDPFLRQMHIGIGCALENLVESAATHGLVASPQMFPEPSDATFAVRLGLTPGASNTSAHARAIPRRHTNRGPYDGVRRPGASVAAALRAQVTHPDTAIELFDADSAAGVSFSDAILASTRALIEDEAFMQATDRWFRWTPREVREHRDGPALETAGLAPWMRVAAQMGPAPSPKRFRESWLTTTRDVHLATSPMFGVLSVRDPSRPAQLVEAGRLWQRVHLEATVLDVALQPLDQWLELVDRSRHEGTPLRVTPRADFTTHDFVPVMMFRAGIPLRPAPRSARRPLDDVIVPVSGMTPLS